MAECSTNSFDVLNGLVHSEVNLMNMLRDLIAQERKDIDQLRVHRYNAVEDLDSTKTTMDLEFNSEEYKCIEQKANFLAMLEKNIVRKQQYAAILSDIVEDRKQNLDRLSNETFSFVSEEMANLNVSSK